MAFIAWSLSDTEMPETQKMHVVVFKTQLPPTHAGAGHIKGTSPHDLPGTDENR